MVVVVGKAAVVVAVAGGTAAAAAIVQASMLWGFERQYTVQHMPGVAVEVTKQW